MNGSIKILKIKGINIYVHWTFIMLIGIILLVNIQNGNDIHKVFWSLAFFISVFISVTLHEFGHALMASRYGIKARGIILLPIGGVASIEKFPEKPEQELLVCLIGPLINLFIAFIIKVFYLQNTEIFNININCSIYDKNCLLINLYFINIGIGLLNLIPAFPMDGGRIFRALLAFKMNYIKATSIATKVGKIIAVGFIALGIILINVILPFVGFFIIFSANTEDIYIRIKSLVKGIKIKDIAIHDYHLLNANMTIIEASEVLKYIYSNYFIIMQETLPISVISRLDIMKAYSKGMYSKSLIDIVNKEIHVIDGEMEIVMVLEKLAKHSEYIHPVIVNNYYAGAISLNIVIEYLLLHKRAEIEKNKILSIIKLLN